MPIVKHECSSEIEAVRKRHAFQNHSRRNIQRRYRHEDVRDSRCDVEEKGYGRCKSRGKPFAACSYFIACALSARVRVRPCAQCAPVSVCRRMVTCNGACFISVAYISICAYT